MVNYKTELKKVVNSISDDDCINLASSCEKIRSINTKKGEDRRKYINLFSEYHDLYKKLVGIRKEEYEKLNDEDTKKTDFNSQFVRLIRKKQEELGITKYLINDVKFGFIVNIVNWLENPELLDKKTIYKPRSKSKKGKSSNNRPKLKIVSMTENTITIEIKSSEKNPVKKIHMKLNNGITDELYIQDDTKNPKVLTCFFEII